VFSSGVVCKDEALLRHELRRVVGKLGGVLAAAATLEADEKRATAYERVGKAASRLARGRALPRSNQ
jgi:hypothetical protein